MYKLKLSYGDYDDVDGPEPDVVEVLGAYKTRYAADWAARDKFGEIMELLDDIETRVFEVKCGYCDYYVVYGYIELELGYVDNVHYYRVSVVER